MNRPKRADFEILQGLTGNWYEQYAKALEDYCSFIESMHSVVLKDLEFYKNDNSRLNTRVCELLEKNNEQDYTTELLKITKRIEELEKYCDELEHFRDEACSKLDILQKAFDKSTHIIRNVVCCPTCVNANTDKCHTCQLQKDIIKAICEGCLNDE